MIITYIRSSSFNRWDWCQNLYYGEYVLGWTEPSGLKALKGTAVHKCLEILANIKLGQQLGKKDIEDDVVGKVSCDDFNIDQIIHIVSEYFKNNSIHKWTSRDLSDCRDWTYKLLNLNNGKFNPLNQDIIAPEKRFDITLQEPWAKYDYLLNNNTISGQLALKGTIDLITKIDNNCIEVTDYKTGFYKKDWATGEEKTYNKLQNDFQLRLYHLAVSILYPEVNNILVSIIYINVDGASTLCYDKTMLEETKIVIKNRFEEIKHCKSPRLHRDWKCTKLCGLGKTTFENTNITPLIEFRHGRVAKYGTTMTKCDQIAFSIKRDGLAKTTEQYMKPGYNVGCYQEPGHV